MSTTTDFREQGTLRLCTAGSVDDGKSTFVGRLLHDTKSILADQLEAVTRVSHAKGLESPDLSLLVDGLRAEREQGITIDVAYRYFATDKRSFILADCPGHVQYTRNTVTGMSTSELVIVLVDARHGVIEQTRRHLTVAAMLGIRHLIIAVNKIDAVDYSEEVFNSIAEDARTLIEQLHEEWGEKHGDSTSQNSTPRVDIVPISALHGDNVVHLSSRTPWYQGSAVLEILETAQPGEKESEQQEEDFRLSVQYVIRDHASDYRGYAGRIAAGQVRRGQSIYAASGSSLSSPSRPIATIQAIDTPHGSVESAQAGESITLVLDTDVDIARGDILTGASIPPARQEFYATVFHLSEQPLALGGPAYLRYGSALVRARIAEIIDRVDISGANRSAEEVAHGRPTELALNDIATIRVEVAEPLAVEEYQVGGAIGSFIFIHPTTGDTLTAGLVTSQVDQKQGEGDDWF